MGLEDRQYYQEDERAWQSGFGDSGLNFHWTATLIIIVTCVVIFFLDALTPLVGPGVHWLSMEFALDTTQPWKIWTFLTSGFVHASIDSKSSFYHVGGNMLALYFLGRHVEEKLGKAEYTKFYLVAIVFASIVFFAVHRITGQPASAVGASGAVSAVVMLFIFYYPKETLYFFGIVPIPAWVLGIALIAMDLARAFDPATRVAWEAHLGGVAFAAMYFKFGWNFKWLRKDALPSFTHKAKLKIHNPETSNEKLKSEADAVLEKIAKEGEDSLTARERRVLNRYSKRLRKDRE